MRTINSVFLRMALVALFSTTLGVGLSHAQYSGGGWNGDGDGNSNCSGSDRYGSDFVIIGLTSDQRLICFGEFRPGNATTIGFVSGLTGGDTALIGIDFRVQDSKLYGVGNAGGVYTIGRTNGLATFVNRLTVALNGTSFGVDFNPAADRLRVISDTGQNLRHNVNAGGVTINDGPLSYAPPAIATGVTAAAYTNNDLDPNTATTLYDIDSNLDQVVIQSPANAGSLAPTGKLLVNTNLSVGFDIYSTIRNESTVNVEGFASLTSASDGRSSFYSITLFNGKASSRGSFAANNQVTDIAIPLRQR